jgi:hypothetical protein
VRLTRLARELQRLLIHPRDHQHLAGIGILQYRRD